MGDVVSIDDTIHGPHGPIPVRRYSPPIGEILIDSPPIVWIHGGGFFKGGLDQPESHDVARALAAEGFRVVTVAYRLVTLSLFRRASSKSINYPVPVDDVLAVVREVQREAPNGVILGGASAGACLAAGTVLRLADGGGEALTGVFFAYGFFHSVLPRRSLTLRGRLRGRRRFLHTPTLLNLTNLNYTGTRAALSEPSAFPGGHPLHDFPPTLMIDADRDSMRASGGQFAQELSAAGIAVDYHVLPEALHAFLNRPQDPSFADGLRLVVDWARSPRSR
jgi:acetyl esterase/lipase